MVESMCKILITTLLMALSCALLRVVNLRRDIRGQQILSLWMSPFFAVAGIVAANILYSHIHFENTSRLYHAEILIANLVIVVVCLLIKLILCFIGKKIWADNALMELTCDGWYEFNMDNSCWFLRQKFANLRSVANVLSWTMALICTVSLAAGWISHAAVLTWQIVFPCAAMYVITEFYNFLCGYTKPEYEHSIGGEGIRSIRIRSYQKLRRVYEETFPSSLLVSCTGNEYSPKQGVTDLLNRWIGSEDETQRLTGQYFQQLNYHISELDMDMVYTTNELMHRENVVIFNPFYRDSGKYILLPIVHCLANGKKCLIVAGRNALKKDIGDWMSDILKEYSHTSSLWRVSELNQNKPDCEVGILSFQQIYDMKAINANQEFFEQTDFVIMVEPSKMMTTAQAGLEIVVESLKRKTEPVYVIVDRETDGLVDVLSHVLQTNLTNVKAAPIPRSVYTAMGWSASGNYQNAKLFDKQIHYLGNGIELAAVALKNQVPHVSWFSAEKAPVKDIQWITGQYYPMICHYAHLPRQQSSMNQAMTFSSNLWASSADEDAFLIVEDEFCNLFATLRAFLTRGTEQSFVNVISENYLLRDYMRYNQRMFMADPKAVPTIASYYAKTERNLVLKLILMMASHPVAEEYIVHEMSIMGYETDELYTLLSALIQKYTFVTDNIITITSCQELDEEFVPIQVRYYSITREVFNDSFSGTLKNAFFVVEDEKLESERIDARMFEHITQLVMPGQFVTYSGKYYRVKTVSPQIGCVLHRASDSYLRRQYYRQLRTYHMGAVAEELGRRKIMDIEIVLEQRAFVVETSGYLEMTDNHDLRNARVIDLSRDSSIADYKRSYKNKNVISIVLPEADTNIRYTICMLMSEIFRTLFPDAWPYLAVLSTRPDEIEGILDSFTYHLDGEIQDDRIYIIEDSDMDLGLLEAVENNLPRIMELMTDYLEWHFEKIREPRHKDPILKDVDIPELPEKQKKKNFLSRVVRQLRVILKREEETEEPKAEELPTDETVEEKPVEAEKPTEAAEVSPFHDEEETTASDPLDQIEEKAELGEAFELGTQDELHETQAQKLPVQNEQTEEETEQPDYRIPENEIIVVHEDGESLLAPDGMPDDIDLLLPIEQSRYQKECFLKLGFDEIDQRLDLDNVKSYLTLRGWSNNALERARKRVEIEISDLDVAAENHCDFCGIPMNGVSFERLSDGRVRCDECSRTAINDVESFKELYQWTRTYMENLYNIIINVSVTVRISDAKTIARQTGSVFQPSTDISARALGFARKKGNQYSLYIENGSPRLTTIDTVTHELTHIWQYLNWDEKTIRDLYGNGSKRDVVYEGMAMWAAIQLLYVMGEQTYAMQQELMTAARNDIYGVGFLCYRERYGMERNGDFPVYSPFKIFPPL